MNEWNMVGYDYLVCMHSYAVYVIEMLQIESTSHRPLCKWQRQSGNSVKAKEKDNGVFFLSLSTSTALERDSLTLRITLARADRFQAGLSTLSVISLWFMYVCIRWLMVGSGWEFFYTQQDHITAGWSHTPDAYSHGD